ncbi:hypothetical protein BGZ73_008979 [Actinomortierella ambigua]|nr:hypothetical protein BGZ73_008979 [Actinomortierella ambigua]
MYFKFVAVTALATLATASVLAPRQDVPTGQPYSIKPADLIPPSSPTTMDAATTQQLQHMLENQSLIWRRPSPYDQKDLPVSQVDAEGQASKWGGWGGWPSWGWPWWWSCYYPWYYGGWWW